MKETVLEKKLKEFYKRVESFYGDEIAFAITVEEKDIKTSLNNYSNNEFEDFTTREILVELLKNEVLCNDEDNLMVRFTKQLVIDKNLDEIEEIFDSFGPFKAGLIHSYINNARRTDEELFDKVNDQYTFDYLDKIEKFNKKNKRIKKRSLTK